MLRRVARAAVAAAIGCAAWLGTSAPANAETYVCVIYSVTVNDLTQAGTHCVPEPLFDTAICNGFGVNRPPVLVGGVWFCLPDL